MENKHGKGRVFAHGGSWWIDISFKGKRRRERVASLSLGAKGKKLAQAVLGKRLSEIAENRFFDVKRDCRATFTGLAEKYSEWAKENHVDYEKSDASFVKSLRQHFGDVLISEISREDVERFKTKRKGEVSPCTVNHELAALRQMFNLAMTKWEHTDDKRQFLFPGPNPAAKFEKLDEKSRERALTKGELTKMLGHISEKIQTTKHGRDKEGYRKLLDFVLLAVTTGMRKGEIQSLASGSKDIHLSELDPSESYVHLRDTKNGEDRKIPLNRISASILSRPFDFAYNPRKLFDRVCDEAGIADFRIHDLRRTFAVFLVNIGADPFTIAGLLGHKLPGFSTTSIYARVQHDRKVEIIGKLEKYLTELLPCGIYGTGAAQTGNQQVDRIDVSLLNT